MSNVAAVSVAQPKLQKIQRMLWVAAISSWGLFTAGVTITHALHLRALDLGMPASLQADLLARHVGEALHVPALASGLVGLVSPQTPYAARCMALLAAMFNCLFVYVLFKGWSLL